MGTNWGDLSHPWTAGEAGSTTHLIAEREEGETETGLRRTLVLTRIKICKRNVPSHEALAAKLGSTGFLSLVQSLMYDHAHHALLFPFKSDSTCVLAMLNPRLELKTVLLANAVEAFKDDLRKISTIFPQALITVGYTPGTSNPSDALTKIFRDPIEIINSSIYRYRPESFGTREGLG